MEKINLEPKVTWKFGNENELGTEMTQAIKINPCHNKGLSESGSTENNSRVGIKTLIELNKLNSE